MKATQKLYQLVFAIETIVECGSEYLSEQEKIILKHVYIDVYGDLTRSIFGIE